MSFRLAPVSYPGGFAISASDSANKKLSVDPKLTAELARLWAQQLGVKKVGPDDNFFALGGHSLLAVKLIAAIQEKTGLTVELADLFEYPTLGAFCDHLQSPAAPGEEWGTL